MSGAEVSGDREAVLDTVRTLFEHPEPSDWLLVGRLREWADLRGREPAPRNMEHEVRIDSLELLELGGDRAVVEVKGGQRFATVRGSWETEIRFDGPVVLERHDGEWRVVDFTVSGRSRLATIVRGPLALQERDGVTVRVLGVDRMGHGTEYLVEVANASDHEVAVTGAWGLFETETAWARIGLALAPPIPPSETRTLLLGAAAALQLDDPVLGLALRVRTGRRKLPFLLKVPLTRPDELVPQRPPRVLPMLRSTWPRSLVFFGLMTAVLVWWEGAEVAVLVPFFIGMSVYLQIRTMGLLETRLRWGRFVVDALLGAALFVLLWTVAPIFAVPALVGAAVYFVLWRLWKAHDQLRLLAALAVATGWLLVLGTYTGPLSPCRVADGAQAGEADSFVRALVAGDRETARAQMVDDPRYGYLPGEMPTEAVPETESTRLVAARDSSALGDSLCDELEYEFTASRCFAYPAPSTAKRPAPDMPLPKTYAVAVRCDGREWRVSAWYPG